MLVVLLAVAAVAALIVGLVGLTGRLRPNRWVGVRNDQTLRDDALWRTANRVAGPAVIAAGAIFAGGACATGGSGSPWGYAYFAGTLVAGVFLAGFGALQGARAASIQAHLQTGLVASTPGVHTAGDTTAAGTADGSAATEDGTAAEACGVSGGCGSCALAGLCTSHSH